MELDFNAFLGRFPLWENKYAEPTGEGLISLMDKNDIKKAVIVSMRAIFDDVQIGNSEVFEAVRRFPDRLIPAITMNPYLEINNRDYLEDCRQKGAKVLKLFPFNHAYPLQSLRDERLDELMQNAKELGYAVCLSYRLFMSWYCNVLSLDAVGKFAMKYKGQPLVIDCANYNEFSTTVDIASLNPDVYAGTSALTMMYGIELLCEQIGAERVLGGTCAPLQIPECAIVKVEQARIAKELKDKILGGNAQKLLA